MRRAALLAAAFALVAAVAAQSRAEPPEAARIPTFDSLPGFTSASTDVRRAWTVPRRSLCRARGPGSYSWPVKPFDAPHPVRGNFGDPRTVFTSIKGLFSFHNGVDVYAHGGTAVYPVVSGRARLESAHEVVVTTRDGRSFQYWHIEPAVRNGQLVRARRTVLGHVLRNAEHVHLAEIAAGVVQNPLAPGHLTPYRDRRPPDVRGVAFRDGAGHELNPRALKGPVAIVAWADDRASLSVPGRWHGLPVTPALVTWRLAAPSGAVVAEGTAADFRRTAPENDDFWQVYTSGTYQNAPAVGREHRLGVPGRYLFNLEQALVDTTALLPGPYLLTVTAEDVCGNRGSLSEPVRIVGMPRPEPPPAPPPVPVAPALPTAGPEQPEPQEPRGPASWPRGHTAYTVVLASVPAADGPQLAHSKARQALAGGLPRVGVLDSDRFPGLQPGYDVVFSGVYPTADAAAAAAYAASSRYPGAYPRLIAAPARRVTGRRGPYVLVLASVPAGAGRSAVLAEAARARAAGIGGVRMLRSDLLRDFRPGYFVIVADRAARGAAVALYPTAYVRLVKSARR